MKRHPLSTALLLALAAPATAADPPATGSSREPLANVATKAIPGTGDTLVYKLPFGRLFGESGPFYSPVFGAVLWKSDGATLSEVTRRPNPVGSGTIAKDLVTPILSAPFKQIVGNNKELYKDIQDGISTRAQNYIDRLKANNSLILRDDYTKALGGNRRLTFDGGEGSAVLLRIRNKFELMNEDNGPAYFEYTDDRNADDTYSTYQGAVMLDIYNDALYNKAMFNPFGWIREPFQVSIRVGAEASYSSSKGNPVDLRKYYALATFAANPDRDARFLTIAGAEITSPQYIQLGLIYTQNLRDDSDEFTPIIGWEPKFRANEGHTRDVPNKAGVDIMIPGTKAKYRGFGINNRMLYSVSRPFQFWQPEDGLKDLSPWYTELKPRIYLQGANGAEINFDDKPANIVKALKDYKETTLRWDIDALLGYKQGLFEITAGAHGVHPLKDLGEAKIHYSLKLAYRPITEHSYYSYLTESGSEIQQTSKWSGVNFYVEYNHGEKAPNYVNEDIVMAGVGLKF